MLSTISQLVVGTHMHMHIHHVLHGGSVLNITAALHSLSVHVSLQANY